MKYVKYSGEIYHLKFKVVIMNVSHIVVNFSKMFSRSFEVFEEYDSMLIPAVILS